MHSHNKEREVKWFWNTRIRGYKFHAFRGCVAWELQIGKHVLQWFYRGTTARYNLGKPFRHWIDPYGVKE